MIVVMIIDYGSDDGDDDGDHDAVIPKITLKLIPSSDEFFVPSNAHPFQPSIPTLL